MPLRRLLILVASFAAMLGVSAWIVWEAFTKSGTPPRVPAHAHLLALGFAALEIVSRTVKIQWGARAMSIPLGFTTSLRTCLGGDFASCVTPARTGAEPARFLVLAESRMATASILLVLFLELLMELTSLIVVSLGLWVVFRGSSAVLGFLTTIITGYAAFVVAVGLTGLLLAQRNAAGPPPQWVRAVGLHAGHWRAIQRALRHLRHGVGSLRHAHRGWLAAAFGASLVHVLARLAILPAIVWSIDPSPELSGLVLWPLVLIYGGSVAPAPGGGGAVEFGFKKAFEGTLAPSVLATSLIWWRVYTLYLYILLGAIAGGRTVFRALRGPAAGHRRRSVFGTPSATERAGTFPPGGA